MGSEVYSPAGKLILDATPDPAWKAQWTGWIAAIERHAREAERERIMASRRRSHAGRHPITLLGPDLCICGQPVVLVETEGGSRNRTHYRHKPQGYRWGDRAHRLRKAAQKVIDAALIEDRLPSSIEQAIMELQYAIRETR